MQVLEIKASLLVQKLKLLLKPSWQKTRFLLYSEIEMNTSGALGKLDILPKVSVEDYLFVQFIYLWILW